MAITIQRTKLSVKSTGLNEPDAPETPEAPETEVAVPQGRVLTARSTAPAPSYTVYGILGIIAFLLMGGLVAIQYLELDSYFKPPAAFPVAGAVPVVAASPAPSAPASQAQPAAPGE
jgi:hypothetical protein